MKRKNLRGKVSFVDLLYSLLVKSYYSLPFNEKGGDCLVNATVTWPGILEYQILACTSLHTACFVNDTDVVAYVCGLYSTVGVNLQPGGMAHWLLEEQLRNARDKQAPSQRAASELEMERRNILNAMRYREPERGGETRAICSHCEPFDQLISRSWYFTKSKLTAVWLTADESNG